MEIEEIKKRYDSAKDAWSHVMEKAADDLHFLSDEDFAQWDEKDANNRVSTGRPVLTIDQLGQFVHQVVNDIRMNTPTINVIPAGDADVELADVYKGIIKGIEYRCSADAVYDNAAEFAVKSSIGFIRVDHEFEDDKSFEQRLCIKPVINPQAIVIDPNSIEPDGSDAKFAFVFDTMDEEEFIKEYPDFNPTSFGGGDEKTSEKKELRLAEYFEIEEEDINLFLLADGSIVEEKPDEFVAKRKGKKKTIKRLLLSGSDILEETTFPGKYVPIIPVYGEISWQDGKRNVFSLIRKSKDAQRMYNFWRSVEADLLRKQPESPFAAVEGTVEDYADDWNNPQKSSVLRYKSTDSNGNPAPAPQRLAPPQISNGIINAAAQTVNDIQSTMGMHGASIGKRTNETSGVAIANRQREAEVGTFHFSDNLTRSITHVGRVLVSAIPEIIDTPRILSVVDEEEETSPVGVNGALVEGQERTFDLSENNFDVRVITGAPFTTKRQESAEFMSQIMQSNPNLLQVFGDIMFKNMDFPGAQAVAERVKKTMPADLTSEEGSQSDILLQQVQDLQQQLQEAQTALESKAQENQRKDAVERAKLELEANKLQFEQQKLQVEQTTERQETAAETAIKQQELEIRRLELQKEIAELQLGDNASQQ